MWYRSDAGKLKYYDGTTARYLATEGGTISGTTNYLSKFTPNGTTLSNSQVYDNGTSVGIGTSSPTNLVHIKAASNPLRIEGLSQATTSSVMVIDATGV